MYPNLPHGNVDPSILIVYLRSVCEDTKKQLFDTCMLNKHGEFKDIETVVNFVNQECKKCRSEELQLFISHNVFTALIRYDDKGVPVHLIGSALHFQFLDSSSNLVAECDTQYNSELEGKKRKAVREHCQMVASDLRNLFCRLFRFKAFPSIQEQIQFMREQLIGSTNHNPFEYDNTDGILLHQ